MSKEPNQGEIPHPYVETSHISITPQGVPDDYENAWQQIRLCAGRMRTQLSRGTPAPEKLAQIGQGLNTPVQTLSAYMEQFYPPVFRASIAPDLNTQTIDALNTLTAEYNDIAGQGTMTHDLAQQFADRAHRLICGEPK